MSAPLIGRGAEVAGWFNTHAKRVTSSRVDAFRSALPDARVFACSSFEEAERHADELVKSPPRILFCGGGDGTVVALLNALRERGAARFPLIGLFKLGTGNGGPSAVGARRYEQELRGIETQARERILEAVVEGQKVAAEIKAQAQREAVERGARADDDIAREREKAKELLKEQMIHLAMRSAEKILRQKLDDASQRKLVGEFIDEVGALR